MNLSTRNIFAKDSLSPTEFPGHHTNEVYYKSGSISPEYLANSEYIRLKNQSTVIYTFHSIIIKQEVYKHASYPYAR